MKRRHGPSVAPFFVSACGQGRTTLLPSVTGESAVFGRSLRRLRPSARSISMFCAVCWGWRSGFLPWSASRSGDPRSARRPPHACHHRPQFTLTSSENGRILHFSRDRRFRPHRRLARGGRGSSADQAHDPRQQWRLYCRGARRGDRAARAWDCHPLSRVIVLSACALIFVGGAQRTLDPDARLGLHGYAMRHDRHFGMIDPKAEDAARFSPSTARRGSPRISSPDWPICRHHPMWYPDHAELEAAGVITAGVTR